MITKTTERKWIYVGIRRLYRGYSRTSYRCPVALALAARFPGTSPSVGPPFIARFRLYRPGSGGVYYYHISKWSLARLGWIPSLIIEATDHHLKWLAVPLALIPFRLTFDTSEVTHG